MKTYFIINPSAGQGNKINSLESEIITLTQNSGDDVEIYFTRFPGDAEEFVKRTCQYNPNSRFIACGGDGTFSEVLNGAMGYYDAQIGVYPIGTGNDFCRNFNREFNFLDVESQLNGETEWCDAIKYSTISDGRKKVGYCANMFNVGFDCNVADMTADMKKKPFISGSFAYFISIIFNLIKKECTFLELELDGKKVHSGKLLLTSIANGSFCGGGIKSNPLASLQDGFININIVKDVSRYKFLKLLPHYMKGDFLNLKNIDSIVLSPKCKRIVLTPLRDVIRICVDGEITSASKIEFEIVPNAFKFVLPAINQKKAVLK